MRGLARQDSRVRCIRRIGRRGLSGACIEGILASSAPYAAVIDADLQHDETQLPKMVALLQSGEAELVVGSRYIEGGSAESFNKQRAGASALATEVARRVLRVEIADPMSGFFMIRRDRFEQLAPQLSTQGFKILLDIVATARGELRIDGNSLHLRLAAAWREQARFHGGARFPRAGAGEADQRRGVAALLAVCDGRSRPACSCISPRCSSRLKYFDVPFPQAQAIGAFVAMTSNFILNNFLTYRDQRLKGFAILRGLLLFYLVCSVGLLANVGVAFSVYDQEPIWWLAGAAGALMGVVWNYAMSGLFVWRKR